MEQFSPLLEPTYRHTLRMWVADPHRNSAILYHSKCPSHTHVVRIRHGFQRGTIVCSSWAHLSTTPHQPLTSRRSPYATPAGWPAAHIQAARSPPWRPPHGSRLKRHHPSSLVCQLLWGKKQDFPGHLKSSSQQAVTTFTPIISGCVQVFILNLSELLLKKTVALIRPVTVYLTVLAAELPQW